MVIQTLRGAARVSYDRSHDGISVVNLHNVDCGWNRSLCRLRLGCVRVDGGQNGSILLPDGLARGALLLSHFV